MSAKRRASKPLMEKRRRDRINQSLAELKDLISASEHYECNYRRNRLEKADILEMTVQYVHQLHNKGTESDKRNDVGADSSDHLFVDGFLECVKEIKNYLNQRDSINCKEDSLITHLDNCVRQLTGKAQQQNKPQQPIGLTFVWRPW